MEMACQRICSMSHTAIFCCHQHAHALLQVSPESLPAYDTYSDGLQPADDALVQRVVLEYWAAFEKIATQHDIKRGDFTKAFRDK